MCEEPYICQECGRAYFESTGNSLCRSCNAEYDRGVAEAKRYQEDKKMFGDELAEQWQLEAELAAYNRGEE